MSVRQRFTIISITASLSIIILAFFWTSALWLFMVILPLIGLGIRDMIQSKHTILRIYPVIGHFRFLLESIRPEIQQYFVEDDTSGTPFSREFRTLVYQRAKGQRDTRPFGTQFDIYRSGYEWIDHSLSPRPVNDKNPRVRFGSSDSNQPYDASPLNISAMSFGALSQNAIMALNKGAKTGNFAHNTGEGGLSPYHLKHGGDLIWQIGTGYFGCSNSEGSFDETLFTKGVGHSAVKMIEIKLSQGAKPGHGGILPAAKLTQEIADIRHVPMGHDVVSPPAHSAFSSPIGLLEFIAKESRLALSFVSGKRASFWLFVKLCS
jgi:glutamate synthase domain-containing protein 2